MTEYGWLTSDSPTEMLYHLLTSGMGYTIAPGSSLHSISDRKLLLLAMTYWWRCHHSNSSPRLHRHRYMEWAWRWVDRGASEVDVELLSRGDLTNFYMQEGPIREWCLSSQSHITHVPIHIVGAYLVDSKKHEQAELLRDVFGNPFELLQDSNPYGRQLHMGLYSCLSSTVIDIARYIYEEHAYENTLQLWDALEDAGCVNQQIRRHLTGWMPCTNCGGLGTVRYKSEDGHGDTDTILCEVCNPDYNSRIRGYRDDNCGWIRNRVGHIRGCWCLDLILGKE